MLKEILEQNLTVDETEKRIAKLLTPKKKNHVYVNFLEVLKSQSIQSIRQ